MKPNRAESRLSLETKKLGPEEAKRSALKEFEDTRNLAMRHTQLKAECYNKAKEAYQRGNTSVALYYSQVANLHKSKIDTYNHKAANCIMEVHNLTQNNPGKEQRTTFNLIQSNPNPNPAGLVQSIVEISRMRFGFVRLG